MPFCATQYSNDARYLLGDTTLEAERLTKPRDDIVQFLQGRSPTSTDDFSSLWIVNVQVLRNTALGKELLVRYGVSTNFINIVESRKFGLF